jgi:hypothetical protein
MELVIKETIHVKITQCHNNLNTPYHEDLKTCNIVLVLP